MRSRQVTRYWCDFCGKGGLQRAAMEKHERYCTLNPLRDCRVCTMINGGSPGPVAELVALLPDASSFNSAGLMEWQVRERELVEELITAMPALREAADNCPACIMAALRQAKIPVPMAPEFDFKEEMAGVFADYNMEHGRHP